MNQPLKIIIIIVLAAVLAFGVYKGIQKYKRHKLAEALTEFAKSKGVIIDQDQLTKNFDRLNDIEMDKLIAFAKNVEAKNWGSVIAQFGSMLPILKKIDYLKVIDKM